MAKTFPARTAPLGTLRALAHGLRDGLRHWRIVLVGWAVGLLPAAIIALPVAGLFNRALGHHPDAAKIVAGNDIAPLMDAMTSLRDGGLSNGLAQIGSTTLFGFAVTAFFLPWLAGMLVGSLRQRRVLSFCELWTAGWHEYGRQFRLLLVSLIPWAIVGGLSMLLGFWAMHGSDEAILASVASERREWAMWMLAIAALLAWLGIESGRAAFAADPSLRSAFFAWLRGLKLMLKRPFAALCVALVTLLLGGGLAVLSQKSALAPSASGLWVVACAQFGVWALWWMRVARLSALTAISPLPLPEPAPVPVPVAAAQPLPPDAPTA